MEHCRIMQIERATTDHLDQLAPLFDQYRIFYAQPADLAAARDYLRARLERGESVVFLALDAGIAAGFTQLYPGFSSVALAPVWTLNDLFVAQGHRRRGVARELMNAAAQHARQTGAIRVELETQADNAVAQTLYAELGYAESTGFRHYALNLAGC
jgi:GNAT superfamily N-acetyltransferase